ncbi:hypothetical protein SEVIR_5G112050v4 [Setaria viridis]
MILTLLRGSIFSGLIHERRHCAQNIGENWDPARCGQLGLRSFRATRRPNTEDQEPGSQIRSGGGIRDLSVLRKEIKGESPAGIRRHCGPPPLLLAPACSLQDSRSRVLLRQRLDSYGGGLPCHLRLAISHQGIAGV